MKSYAEHSPEDGTQFKNLVIPAGRELPRGNRPGEMFHLIADMPAPHNPNVLNSWYPRGTYVCNGVTWDKLNDAGRQCKSSIIGSQTIEIENPSKMMELPIMGAGVELCQVILKPSFQKATVSGSAALWVSTKKNANIWLVVFSESTIVGLVLNFVEVGKHQNMAITFLDTPNRVMNYQYSLRLYSDVACEIGVNKSMNAYFDGISSTAFTVSENT